MKNRVFLLHVSIEQLSKFTSYFLRGTIITAYPKELGFGQPPYSADNYLFKVKNKKTTLTY